MGHLKQYFKPEDEDVDEEEEQKNQEEGNNAEPAVKFQNPMSTKEPS
jgi:hypothetical protein